MKHRLLILGSLMEFVQLIDLAKSQGIYTIVCDGYPDSPGKRHADKAYDIPPGEIERIAALCREERVDGIITSFSDYLFECMVKIAARAELKCYFQPDKLELYRNKAAMKEMLDTLDIPNARSAVLTKDFPDEALAGIRFPVVAKPLDKYGSRGVLILNSVKEIRQEFDYICETSDVKQVLIEEYNDGYEFNMMTWLIDGKVQVLSIADREKTAVNSRDIPISTRNVYPSRLMPHVYEEARDILQKIADYTGQREGILSMQFFWKPGRPVSVCEVAGRFLGYEHELIEYCSGLAVERLLLHYVYDEQALRKDLEGYSPFFQKQSAVLYFHGKNGMTVSDQSKARELASLAQVCGFCTFYKEGETVVPHGPNPYVLRYYLTAGTREEIDSLTSYLYRNTAVTDPEGNSVIYENQIPRYPDFSSDQ
ncbi:MAG: ATP-grasp domain-containing protein [Eubacteriales bacterium]|nr:ATP-grasp domain-containing protein [Eubacteriales bacterium]